jgi:hypothetical protein
LYITAHLLDEPLSQTVLGQLELAPCVEEIITRLEGDASKGKWEHLRDRQRITNLEKEIKTLKALLPCCVDEATGVVDKEKEKHYWEQIRKADQQLQELLAKPTVSQTETVPDYAKVRDFLMALPANWKSFSRTLRNRFLKALIDHVELKSNNDVEATIYWKAGFQQKVIIHRNRHISLADKLWNEAEDQQIKQLFPSSSRAVVLAALPGRSWKAITLRAERLKLKRRWMPEKTTSVEPWTEDEVNQLKLGFEKGLSIPLLAKDLNRNWSSVSRRIKTMGLKPVPILNLNQARWEVYNLNPLQELSSEGIKGRFYHPGLKLFQ